MFSNIHVGMDGNNEGEHIPTEESINSNISVGLDGIKDGEQVPTENVDMFDHESWKSLHRYRVEMVCFSSTSKN